MIYKAETSCRQAHGLEEVRRILVQKRLRQAVAQLGTAGVTALADPSSHHQSQVRAHGVPSGVWQAEIRRRTHIGSMPVPDPKEE